jgi:hypothetical protein
MSTYSLYEEPFANGLRYKNEALLRRCLELLRLFVYPLWYQWDISRFFSKTDTIGKTVIMISCISIGFKPLHHALIVEEKGHNEITLRHGFRTTTPTIASGNQN